MKLEPLRTIVITGAAGGVGRSIARTFVSASWNVVLCGRNRTNLDKFATELDGHTLVCECDVADPSQVQHMAETIESLYNGIDALVNSAAINIIPRKWSEVSPEDFDCVISTNLRGAFHCMRAFLPALRKRQGTIVNINSEAGHRATAKAGCSYVASKYGLAGLTESFNAEERLNGVRAISIFPGEINTSLLDRRLHPPSMEERMDMVQPEDIAACVWTAVSLAPRTVIESMVVRPTRTTYQ